MKIELELCGFETSKLLRDKGFPQSKLYRLNGISYYNYKGELNGDSTDSIKERVRAKFEEREVDTKYISITAPTLAVVQKWLRSEDEIKYPIEIIIEPHLSFSPRQYKCRLWRRGMYHEVGYFDTYEQAQVKAIVEALKLI